MESPINFFYDPEGDFLEITIRSGPGHVTEVDNDHISVKVNERGEVLGFMVIGLSKMAGKDPVSINIPRIVNEVAAV